MESCLKKLVLEAAATGFQDPEKGGWEQWDHLGENIVLGGPDWRQTGILCLATIQTASKKVHGRREFLV